MGRDRTKERGRALLKERHPRRGPTSACEGRGLLVHVAGEGGMGVGGSESVDD